MLLCIWEDAVGVGCNWLPDKRAVRLMYCTIADIRQVDVVTMLLLEIGRAHV